MSIFKKIQNELYFKFLKQKSSHDCWFFNRNGAKKIKAGKNLYRKFFLSSIGGEEAKSEEETDLLLRDFDDCQFISLFSLSRIFCRISFEKSQNWNKTFLLQPCFFIKIWNIFCYFSTLKSL